MARSPRLEGFTTAELDGVPEPVRRYLSAAIAPGTPLTRAARLRMSGQIKLGRWLPFRAHERLDLPLSAVWSARAAGVITGYDRLTDGYGEQDWRILGLVRVLHAEGEDIGRSAAGRFGAEAVWLPTALLPRFGVSWTTHGDRNIQARYQVGGTTIALHCHLDEQARLVAASFDRWGDPDGTGRFGVHPFGIEATATATFGGLTIPSEGRAGWFPGTDRWDDAVFFRYRITDLMANGGAGG